jgi:N-acetylneuraminic acid mutarotase
MRPLRALVVAVAFTGGVGLACNLDHGRPKGSAPAGEKAVSPLWAGPAHSGSWYAPERNGEGFTLQVLDNGTAHVIWFTYPPPGSTAQQAWIYASGGRVESDRIRFDGAFTTRGPRFGPTFDPNAVEIVPWGTLEFRFTGCNAAEVTWSGPAAWGSGTRALTRLTSLAELECTGKRALGVSGERTLAGLRARSGAWFDPAHNGEGWNVEELPDGRAQVYWFTYDERGEQAWTIGVAPASGNRITVAQNFRPVGARFGPAFDPAQVQATPWGSVDLELSSCTAGRATYQSTLPGFGSGSLSPARLTVPAGAACVDGTPAAPAGATWSQAARMPAPASEHGTAIVGSSAYVAAGFGDPRGFKRYDMASDTWTRLASLPGGRDHPLMTAYGGDIYVTGGYRQETFDQPTSGFRYIVAEDRWEDRPELPDYPAAGAAVLNGYIYFSNIQGGLVQYDPRTRASRTIAGDGLAPRDHSQLAAFQGELWVVGGRGPTRTANNVSIWDPASETWRRGPSLITARAGFAIAATPTMLLVAGGEVLNTDPWRTLTAAEAIVAGASRWSEMPPLPNAVHGLGAGLVRDNAFYVLGGSGMAGGVLNGGQVQVLRW